MLTTRGAAAYAAYSIAVGGKTFDGARDLPTFEELGQAQQAGWIAAADTAGFACRVGDNITTRQGYTGEVTHLSVGRDRRGVWIEGKDSTGRPFETYVAERDICATSVVGATEAVAA